VEGHQAFDAIGRRGIEKAAAGDIGDDLIFGRAGAQEQSDIVDGHGVVGLEALGTGGAMCERAEGWRGFDADDLGRWGRLVAAGEEKQAEKEWRQAGAAEKRNHGARKALQNPCQTPGSSIGANEISHSAPRGEARGEFDGIGGVGFGAGMEIDFRGAGAGVGQGVAEGGEVHVAAGTQAKSAIGHGDAGGPQAREGGSAEAGEDGGDETAGAGFADEPGSGEAEAAGGGHREGVDDGMLMEVGVAVPVGRGETELAEADELPVDLGGGSGAEPGAEGVFQAGPGGAILYLSRMGGQNGNLGSGAAAEGEVQADAEGWVALGNGDGFGDEGSADHETGLIEGAGAVIGFDGGVDLRIETKVVARDDEAAGGGEFGSWHGRAGRRAWRGVNIEQLHANLQPRTAGR